jgi:murein DD-endopeptidase MepM/ murein hydrolase activator NlpD
MLSKISIFIEKFWSNYFPNRQLLLKTGSDTKFITLSSSTQAIIIFAVFIFVGWSLFSSLIFTFKALNLGVNKEYFARSNVNYEDRIEQISDEKYSYLQRVKDAEAKLREALEAIEDFQVEITKAQIREEELQSGILILQGLIKQTKNNNFIGLEEQKNRLNNVIGLQQENTIDTLPRISILMSLLEETVKERDDVKAKLAKALEKVDQLSYEADLSQQNNEQIFRQIEEALVISVKPLEKMFKSVGLDLNSLLNVIRNTYSGYGGPNLPISKLPIDSLTNNEKLAAKMVDQILELGAWRIALQKIPFAHPLNETFQYTSGFGPRWGTMHYGTDMAAKHGSAILATADGVINFAGWEKGYGKLIKIKHDFGYETRYAHLSKINVSVGQRISQGDRIGKMGNTGRSTGTHLHYEIRRNGKPINPMKYIRARQNVF